MMFVKEIRDVRLLYKGEVLNLQALTRPIVQKLLAEELPESQDDIELVGLGGYTGVAVLSELADQIPSLSGLLQFHPQAAILFTMMFQAGMLVQRTWKEPANELRVIVSLEEGESDSSGTMDPSSENGVIDQCKSSRTNCSGCSSHTDCGCEDAEAIPFSGE